MLKLRLLTFFLLIAAFARAETPAQANKRLFDKTIDELNFRTMETVYDKSFTRGKFPLTLRTAAARRTCPAPRLGRLPHPAAEPGQRRAAFLFGRQRAARPQPPHQ